MNTLTRPRPQSHSHGYRTKSSRDQADLLVIQKYDVTGGFFPAESLEQHFKILFGLGFLPKRDDYRLGDWDFFEHKVYVGNHKKIGIVRDGFNKREWAAYIQPSNRPNPRRISDRTHRSADSAAAELVEYWEKKKHCYK